MSEISITIKGLKKIKRGLAAQSKAQERALNTAVKVEGFRLMTRLKREISQGHPGGRHFAALTEIAKRSGSKRVYGKADIKKFAGIQKVKALRRLGRMVRYHIPRKKPFQMRIGWVGPRMSKKWKALGIIHQEGFTRRVTEKQRRAFRRRLKAEPNIKFFKIKKSTTQFRTPARPILDPFWRAYHDDAWRNIRSNFRRKMRGERI